MIKRLETWLLEEHKDEVKSVSSWIGNGGPRWYLSLSPESANPNYGMLNVLTTREDPAFVAALIKTVNDHGRSAFPDARVSAKSTGERPSRWRPYSNPSKWRRHGHTL